MNKVAFLPSKNSQSSDRYVWKVIISINTIREGRGKGGAFKEQ